MTTSISTALANKPSAFESSETLTQSTATAVQAISIHTGISILGMGTATGFARNRYALASGAKEGQEKLIISEATGEAKVFIAAQAGTLPAHIVFAALPTATSLDALLVTTTGDWVFQSAEDYVLLKYISGVWTYLNLSGATIATST